MATVRQMCDDVSTALEERGCNVSSRELFDASPTGELSHVFELYWSLFPERMPPKQANPIIGDLAYENGHVCVWTGGQWGQWSEQS